METKNANQREFARIDVKLRARFQVLEAEKVELLEEELLHAPSVWSVEGESEVVKLASSAQSGSDGLLARAIVDTCRQIQLLTHRVLDAVGPMQVGSLVELSGGGGKFSTRLLLAEGACLDIRILDDAAEIAPIRFLAEVMHVDGSAPARYGIKFRAIHPADRERLIRYVYQVQRRALREANQQDS